MNSINTKNTLIGMMVVYLVMTSCVTGSSLGLGLHGPWNKLQHHLKSSSTKGHIRVRFPSGVVQDMMWSVMKPLLKSYVCRLCVLYPRRCEGDIRYCKMIITRERRDTESGSHNMV